MGHPVVCQKVGFDKDRFNQKSQTVPFKHPHDSFTVFCT